MENKSNYAEIAAQSGKTGKKKSGEGPAPHNPPPPA